MKKLLPLILGMGAKMATTVSLLFGSLALISSKALIVGKLALIVSVVVLLQYLFGTGRVNIQTFNIERSCVCFHRVSLEYLMEVATGATGATVQEQLTAPEHSRPTTWEEAMDLHNTHSRGRSMKENLPKIWHTLNKGLISAPV